MGSSKDEDYVLISKTLRNNHLNAYSSILRHLAEYAKAKEYYELALNSDLVTYGEDHPQVAIGRNNLGSVYRALGDYPKAIEYLELAYKTMLPVLVADHPGTKTVKGNLDSAIEASKK
jgi:tetratricopeptide (TPR) repeat protein